MKAFYLYDRYEHDSPQEDTVYQDIVIFDEDKVLVFLDDEMRWEESDYLPVIIKIKEGNLIPPPEFGSEHFDQFKALYEVYLGEKSIDEFPFEAGVIENVEQYLTHPCIALREAVKKNEK